MSLEFITPEITSSSEKPPCLPNKAYPYAQLADSRRFEELVYSIYKRKIDLKEFEGRYEKINLLQGVRERGRDCSLHFKENCVGLIQCKHSTAGSSRIDKPECAREIIKFVLHSLIDSSLVYDIQAFDYYFAVSHGFTESAKDLLDDFNRKIVELPELQKWTEAVITSNRAFSGVNFIEIEEKLKEHLASIRIHKILPQDLDLDLSKFTDISSLFFEQRVVIDAKKLDESMQEIKEAISAKTTYNEESHIPEHILLQQIKAASFQLSNVIAEFENVPDSHIERSETQELLHWIKGNIGIEEKPVMLLAGLAGMGKTTVMKDLLDQLNDLQIPVLGLKADRYYVNSVKELADRLDLSEPIDKIILTLRHSHERVVVIIDQLDALSQSLSARREYMDTFNLLVQKLCSIDHVRIIISVRTYDLHYDNDLKFYKNQKKVLLNPLTIPQVIQVLTALGVPDQSWSGILLELLRVPQHLNVFCKIYVQGLNLQSITTLHDLYNELWRQKVLASADNKGKIPEQCQPVLFEIAREMQQSHKISLKCLPKDVADDIAINYLKSNQLLIQTGAELQFFHQSFYDYVFAKQFISSGKDIITYIQDNRQGLFIRSNLKMLLVFLREQDQAAFIKVINTIILKRAFRFHIKLLIINELGFNNQPGQAEIQFVRQKIIDNKRYIVYFLESFLSNFWLKYLIDHRQINHMLIPEITTGRLLNLIPTRLKGLFGRDEKTIEQRLGNNRNLVFVLLRRNLTECLDLIIDFLANVPEFTGRERFVTRLLYFLKTWESPKAFQLFERYLPEFANDQHGLLSILEDMTLYDIDYVISHFRETLLSKVAVHQISDQNKLFTHDDLELLKKILQTAPEKGLAFLEEIINSLIQKTQIPSSSGQICENLTYWLFDYGKSNSYDGPEALLQLFVSGMIDVRKIGSDYFNGYFTRHYQGNSATMLLCIIWVLLEEPKADLGKLVLLCQSIDSKKGFNSAGKLQFWLRKLVNTSYLFLEPLDRIKIEEIYLNTTHPDDYQISGGDGTKKHNLDHAGFLRYTYLRSIPSEGITNGSKLQKELERLKRKFNDRIPEDEEPNRIRVRGVPAPLTENAYKKMDFAAWESSFNSYNQENRDYRNGSMLEHGRTFSKEVKARPVEFADFVERLIDEHKVPSDYIIKGVEGLIESEFDPERLVSIYKKAIRLNLNRELTLYLVWKADYFIKSKLVDETILDFLCALSANHPDPEIDDGTLMQSANSVRGAATSRILRCYFNPVFAGKIFDALFLAAKDPASSVRISILPELAYLNSLDKQKGLEIFLLIISQPGGEIDKYAIYPLPYMLNVEFDRLAPYLHKLIADPASRKGAATCLTGQYISGNKEALKMLNQVISTGDEAAEAVLDAAIEYILDDDVRLRKVCLELFIRFLNNRSEQIAHRYSIFFLKLSPERFLEILPVIKKYATSKAATKSPGYYYQYLLKCCKHHPLVCIDLLKSWKKYDRPDISKSGHYENEPIALIIGCYNAIREEVGGKTYIDKAMDIFDKMLQDDRFRVEANVVMERVEH